MLLELFNFISHCCWVVSLKRWISFIQFIAGNRKQDFFGRNHHAIAQSRSTLGKKTVIYRMSSLRKQFFLIWSDFLRNLHCWGKENSSQTMSTSLFWPSKNKRSASALEMSPNEAFRPKVTRMCFFSVISCLICWVLVNLHIAVVIC